MSDNKLLEIYERYENVYGEDGYPCMDFNIGDIVLDILTCELKTILKVTGKDGIFGYWVDSKYLGGGRHPWELNKLRKKNGN